MKAARAVFDSINRWRHRRDPVRMSWRIRFSTGGGEVFECETLVVNPSGNLVAHYDKGRESIAVKVWAAGKWLSFCPDAIAETPTGEGSQTPVQSDGEARQGEALQATEPK